jgi:hypothetical protein
MLNGSKAGILNIVGCFTKKNPKRECGRAWGLGRAHAVRDTSAGGGAGGSYSPRSLVQSKTKSPPDVNPSDSYAGPGHSSNRDVRRNPLCLIARQIGGSLTSVRLRSFVSVLGQGQPECLGQIRHLFR